MKDCITIIQPGRLGDLIITLPIAYQYHKQGFDIVWPVASEYIDLFRNVSFFKDMIIYNLGSINANTGKVIKNFALSHIPMHSSAIDLAIGFGDIVLDRKWKDSQMSFDVWKYNHAAKMSYSAKYDLPNFIIRDKDQERGLMAYLRIKKGEKYIITHSNGSHGRNIDFNRITDFNGCRTIEISQVEGYNVFDWLGILEGAYQIFCVDSSISNLVDQFGIKPEGGRFFHPWVEYYSTEQLKLLTPNIEESSWVWLV